MCSITASVWVHKNKLSYWEWSAAALELSLLSDSFPLKHILFGCRSCSPAPLSTKSSEHTVIFHYQHCILVFLMISEHEKLSNVLIQAPCAHSVHMWNKQTEASVYGDTENTLSQSRPHFLLLITFAEQPGLQLIRSYCIHSLLQGNYHPFWWISSTFRLDQRDLKEPLQFLSNPSAVLRWYLNLCSFLSL